MKYLVTAEGMVPLPDDVSYADGVAYGVQRKRLITLALKHANFAKTGTSAPTARETAALLALLARLAISLEVDDA